jgi:L,D-transpeptidase ErfK/SrfK
MHRLLVGLLLPFVLVGSTAASSFRLPQVDSDLIGQVQVVRSRSDQTLLDIAREYGIGQEEMLLANPGVDRWLPGADSVVVIPDRYVLPRGERRGLMLNLPEMRLYEFPDGHSGTSADQVVHTFPTSIGRMDWKTPLGEARIVRKQRDPSWYPPESVRKEAIAAGNALPDVVPPGPDNPLGRHALRLNLPGYLIHGTNRPFGVGMRVTHGCVRMLPEDIEDLFERVSVGTPVQILNQPVKVGWHDDVLYVEVHPPLEEDEEAQRNLMRYTLERVYEALEKRPAVLDAKALRQAVEKRNGIPVAVSKPDESGRSLKNPLFR